MAQHTVSGTVFNDLDGSAKGAFTNIQTGSETGANANGYLHVYVVNTLDFIVATATVNPNGSYTSSSYNAILNNVVYLVLDTLVRNEGDFFAFFYTIKMPAAWTNTSPYMTANIFTGGTNITGRNFGIQKNGFLTIPDFSLCDTSDSLFTWYFRGVGTVLTNGNTIEENSGTSDKISFLKVTAKYFTNNDSYSADPLIYSPSNYTINDNGGSIPIPSALEYHTPVLEIGGASFANGITNDSIGISVAFKNTNGQKLYIQKLNNAVLDLDTYESLKVTGYNNGAPVKPLIYISNGYGDNATNDMRSFYMGNTAWIFNTSTGYQATETCNAWCDYSYNAVAIMEFSTPVDSIFYTARITEPTGNRGYESYYLGSNEITGFNYCPVTIQGNLWNDINGNGFIDGSETNVLNATAYINLIDEYGMVLSSTKIQSDGTYTFANLPQLATTSTMRLQISTTQGVIGNIPPATSVPNTYEHKSENKGGLFPETGVSANKEILLPLLLSSNLKKYDFGIAPITILPLTLENFTVTIRDANTVVINWKVNKAVNIDHFEIERSSNEIDFMHLTTVTYDRSSANYSFTDLVYETGAYQYRLKLIGIDGEITYSDIFFVEIENNLIAEIQVYPNPVTNRLTISGVNVGEEIKIYNNKGQIVKYKKVVDGKADIDMTFLLNGIYHVVVIDKDGKIITESKIVKLKK
ncbi:MAG: T9SS type A sorting domain-containing protein [Bacteroidota bacterium]